MVAYAARLSWEWYRWGDGYHNTDTFRRDLSVSKKKEKAIEEKKFPRTKIQWMWDNMEGRRALFVIAILGTITYNAMQLVIPMFSGKIVDEFISGENAAYNLANNRDRLLFLIALMVGATLLRTVIVYLDCMSYEHVSQTVLYRVRNFLFNKIERQDMHFYKEFRTGDLMTRVTGDLDALRHLIAWIVRMIVEAVALMSATLIYFFYINVKLTLCLLAIAPLILIIISGFRKKVRPMHATLREKLAGMNTNAQENISGNRVVKAFAREDYEIEKFDECNKDYRDTNIKTQMVWLKYYPFVESCANLMPVVLLLVGGIFLINGELSMGQYVAFSGLIWAISNPMRMLGNIMNEFQRFAAAANKVMEIYYSEPEIVDHDDAIELDHRIKGDIEFKNVSFKFDDAATPLLKDISFSVKAGETVAIMGETGCGKTSLIHLIPRFYEPTSGEIFIDGINVNKYKLRQLRKNIGLATQDVLLYSDTIDGNIAYGDSTISKEEVLKFARYSQASEFIAKMPEGYETIVGERGVGLSGGQKQRISLARALAVRPSILILDDTTSAVDMETEKEIQKALNHLDFECTKIIIAQRISTTKSADKIIVLKDGVIAEEGSHRELIDKKGYYYELVKLQAGEEAV